MNTTLGEYYKTIDRDKYENITEKKEKELGKRANKGDNEAREKLINAYLRWAVTQAKAYTGWGVPLKDLVQAANEGLIKAVDKFDPDKGRLFYFARFFVLAELNRTLANESGAVSLSSSMRKKAYNAHLFYKEVNSIIKKGLPKEEAIDKVDNAMQKRDYWKYIEGYIKKNDKMLTLTFSKESSEKVWVKISNTQTDRIIGKNKLTPELLFKYLTDEDTTLEIRPSLQSARHGSNPALSIDIRGEESTDKLTEENIVDQFTTSRDVNKTRSDPQKEAERNQFLQKIHRQKFKIDPDAWKAYKLRYGLRETGDGRYVWYHLLNTIRSRTPVLLKTPLNERGFALREDYGIPTASDYPGIYEGYGVLSYEVDDENKVYYGAPQNMMEKNGVKYTEVTGKIDKLDYPWRKVKKTLNKLLGGLELDGSEGRSLKEVAIIMGKSSPLIHNLEWKAKRTLFHNLEQKKLKSLLG